MLHFCLLPNVVSSGVGPGKRWKSSMVSDGYKALLFGGMRMWHGFASDNSEANRKHFDTSNTQFVMNHSSSTQSNLGHHHHSFRWESRRELPAGGYLNDLWILEKCLVCICSSNV